MTKTRLPVALPGAPMLCTARRGDGVPCKAYAIQGGRVCKFHGGSAAQVREAARRRLDELAPDVLDIYAEMIRSEETPPAVRARLLQDHLDRIGTKAPEEHVLIPQQETNAALDAGIVEALRLRGIEVPATVELPESTPEVDAS